MTIDLEPESAMVEGVVRESSGRALSGIKIGSEPMGAFDASTRLFDAEVSPASDGRFVLRLPARLAHRVVVFSSGRVLARVDVNGGKPLEPLRTWHAASKKHVQHSAYDLGAIPIDMPRTGPMPVEREFETYFARGQKQFESGDLEAARGSYEIAQGLIGKAPEEARRTMTARITTALRQVHAKQLETQVIALEGQAKQAREKGDLDMAEKLAREALGLDGELIWPEPLLQDIVLERKRRAMTAAADSEKGSGPSATASGRVIEGFRFKAKNAATGLDEYAHEKTGLEFVLIPGGTFTMGSPDGEEGHTADEAQHEVTLTPYLIAKTEVTQEVWERVMGSNPSKFKGAKRPVETVSWDEVSEFCRKVGLELPSEAQWEYACRAKTTGAYAGKLDDLGWYGEGPNGTTHNVRTKQPNGFGLFDIHGNVWEWCADWLGDYPMARTTNPRGPDTGEYRVRRGGSYWYDSGFGRSALRQGSTPGNRNHGIGFRPARSLRLGP